MRRKAQAAATKKASAFSTKKRHFDSLQNYLFISLRIVALIEGRLGSELRWKRSVDGVQRLFAARVLCDGLCALRNGVLCELAGQNEANGGLDFARRDGRLFVVLRESRRLDGDTLENVLQSFCCLQPAFFVQNLT